ncbi:MAG TPA: SRPBCC domain-containing protein [Acidimicrobiales bacterium]|jgi:uncharacterized protein YndB with AHSA1/START domain|nr:SRPBCC domain-containing protein [Acidimicrobiales bacterium]
MTVALYQRIGIEVPQDQVHRAFSTIEGLASWWTTDTTGDPGVGGKLTFTFGSPERSAGFEVLEVADDRIVWRGIAGPEEWIDTTFTWTLSQQEGETVVELANEGWREAVPFIGHCSTKWATFLVGLKALLEGGRSNVYPDEVVISSWDR